MIIWANYIHNIQEILKVLKKQYPYDRAVSIYGAVSVADRDKAVDNFQNDKYTKFMVGNPATGGLGLNLTAANTVVYFSNSYDLTLREQSEDRAHRKGQTKSVTYIDLVMKGTIDEFIILALNKKKKMSAQTLGEDVLNFL
jgi:SNF2 family DNA or RNA helicase